MNTPARTALSHLVGWAMDRKLPKSLRPFAYRTFARITGADLEEARPPLVAYPTLGTFFVRRLVDGARTFPADPSVLPSPCDGHVQSIEVVEDGTLLQAKGQPYSLGELLGLDDQGSGDGQWDLNGATAWTIYLSPRDYHRIHCPVESTLEEVKWIGGCRFSVAPKVLARTPRVFVENERAVIRLRSAEGPWFLVLVGALNVGRIRVVGVETGATECSRHDPSFERGEELGRFEMGSTAILVFPKGRASALPGLREGSPLRMGDPIGSLISG